MNRLILAALTLSGAFAFADESACRTQMQSAWNALQGGAILRIDHSANGRVWTVVGKSGARMRAVVLPETTACLIDGDPKFD